MRMLCACVLVCARVPRSVARRVPRVAQRITTEVRKEAGTFWLTAEDEVQLRALVCQPLVVWHARVRHRNHEFTWGCGLSAFRGAGLVPTTNGNLRGAVTSPVACFCVLIFSWDADGFEHKLLCEHPPQTRLTEFKSE